MKKILLLTYLFCIALTINAQDLVSKIPKDAKAVVSIKGKNVTDLVSVSEFENSKIGKLFLKEMRNETDGRVSNLNELGIDLNRDFYYFMTSDSLSLKHHVLVPFKDKTGFEKLMPERQKKKIITDGDLSYFVDTYDSMITMWNNNMLLMVVSQETYNNDYYSYNDYSVEEVAEEVVLEEEEVEVESTESEIEVEETVIEPSEPTYNNDYYENLRKDREAKKLLADKALVTYAKSTIKGNHTNGSILKNTKYVKAIGNGKDEAVAWIGDFSSIYSDMLQNLSYGMGPNYLGLYDSFQSFYSDMSLTSKLNFEKSQASLKTRYTMNNDMAKYTEAMYNGKMNSNFFKYFNEDKMLGYFAVNISTKGVLEAYPEMMSKMFEGYNDDEVAAFVPIGMKILSLLIDEEGAAQLLRGDMLFVLTEMKERELTYTTYEYDENYEREEVTKTKKETLPGFLMMLTSSEGDLFHKLMNIAVKESRGEVTLSTNGIYQLTTSDLPLTINVAYKDNAILIGSSFEDLVAIKTGKFNSKVSGKHKSLIKKNSSAIYVNGHEIASTFPREMMPNAVKEKIDFISQNTEDVIFKTGKIKNNAMEGEMILNVPEKGHNNSLAYFLNMINALMD
ncbi:hypothetical protein HNV10_03330 [Winogradskyella litoriviva]|uniref:DUF4836 family protein n=1 Tax=Winogradskyella litoriviva TaxID=1220182 RepID=A0ABX2E1G1_9FLAO|nr:hypothetical protein [Winogradskyella litoriviva]NRD22257.1 hypothetical protein [Winogradskyella litoriviva]